MKVKKLMIIDDDRDDINFFVQAITKLEEKYECMVVEKATIALKQLQTSIELPDFIFLDLNMPIMSGRQFLKEIKSNTVLKDIPVIIYSTSTSQKDLQALLNLGAAYYLPKPMDLVGLPQAIAAAIAHVIQNHVERV